MIALIDGDLISYPVAASCEDCTEDIAIARCHKTISDILFSADAKEYKLYLTGSNNFRKKINPEYKANRKNKPLPQYLNLLREYLVSDWKAEVTDGYEADDAIGIAAHQGGEANVIICSYDKDLNQLAGTHFDWYKNDTYYVSELNGIRHFYKQMLIGDRSDNIIGVPKIGKVRANKLLNHINTEPEMVDIVYPLYDKKDRFDINADCLWILRKENEMYSKRKDLYV
jgi:5'-3' exonuclease